jgi:hypothetical protein
VFGATLVTATVGVCWVICRLEVTGVVTALYSPFELAAEVAENTLE